MNQPVMNDKFAIMIKNIHILMFLLLSFAGAIAQTNNVTKIEGTSGLTVFEIRDIPDGTPKQGHGESAEEYGYRIPSLLVSNKGTTLAFVERRLGLHDHHKMTLY